MLIQSLNASDANLVSLMHCGNRFDIPAIIQEVEVFLERDVRTSSLEAKTVVEALLIGFQCLQR